jgi:hypothetical protein
MAALLLAFWFTSVVVSLFVVGLPVINRFLGRAANSL